MFQINLRLLKTAGFQKNPKFLEDKTSLFDVWKCQVPSLSKTCCLSNGTRMALQTNIWTIWTNKQTWNPNRLRWQQAILIIVSVVLKMEQVVGWKILDRLDELNKFGSPIFLSIDIKSHLFWTQQLELVKKQHHIIFKIKKPTQKISQNPMFHQQLKNPPHQIFSRNKQSYSGLISQWVDWIWTRIHKTHGVLNEIWTFHFSLSLLWTDNNHTCCWCKHH